ncbi:MAG: histidinol-phosphatase [Treponema sp.]|nr:histidinol-phosphatase [Treponema sp.]
MKTNYHTHSTFCDGKNTVREMIEEAIRRNFSVLGFSSHCMYPFSSDWHIPTLNIPLYVDEVKKLRDEYASKLDVKLAFEVDFIPSFSIPLRETYKQFSPDYLIGAVHYLANEDFIFTVDGSADEVKNGLEKVFSGDGKKMVQSYFSAEKKLLEKGEFDILAHADLIRKLNGRLNFFDEKDSWYREELKSMAKAISKSGVIVEINTGGMARGYTDSPYPSAEFLSILKEYNIPVTIDSDAHNADKIDFAFDFAKEHAIKAGYKELAYIEDGNIKFQPVNEF